MLCVTGGDHVRWKKKAVPVTGVFTTNSTISSLKHTCNRLLTLLTLKNRNVDTEKLRMRTGRSIMKVVVTRDIEITAYNEYRRCLIDLGAITSSSMIYPLLSPADTVKKDPNGKRWAGDSKRREGTLWTIGEASKRLGEVILGDDLPVGLMAQSSS